MKYALAGTAVAQAPHTHHHSFTDAEKWACSFDDPKRDTWQKPREVITALALALAPDAVVADIGAGTGYIALRLAHFVPRGRVLAVDSEAKMVKHLEARAQKAGLPVKQRISAGKVKAETAAAGYRVKSEPAFLPNQYMIIFEAVQQ